MEIVIKEQQHGRAFLAAHKEFKDLIIENYKIILDFCVTTLTPMDQNL